MRCADDAFGHDDGQKSAAALDGGRYDLGLSHGIENVFVGHDCDFGYAIATPFLFYFSMLHQRTLENIKNFNLTG
jgi:hypothetical protein